MKVWRAEYGVKNTNEESELEQGHIGHKDSEGRTKSVYTAWVGDQLHIWNFELGRHDRKIVREIWENK